MKNDYLLNARIEYILNNFDFHKVHKAMEILNWRWVTCDEDEAPPITKLREEARRLLEEVYKMKTKQSINYTGCGGFNVSYDKKYDVLTLNFCIEEWES